MHRYGPVGFDDCVPDAGEDDFVVGSDQIVVTVYDVGAYHVDVEECLADEVFHSLDHFVLEDSFMEC